MLPGAEGIELTGVIPELPDVPVIFISGYGLDETLARARASLAECRNPQPRVVVAHPEPITMTPDRSRVRALPPVHRAAPQQPQPPAEAQIHHRAHRSPVSSRWVSAQTTRHRPT